MLIVVSGLPGTGKSAIADGLARELRPSSSSSGSDQRSRERGDGEAREATPDLDAMGRWVSRR